MTISNTMKWQNNLRSHEVRSEFNNSFSFIHSLALISFLRVFFFHSLPPYLTLYQCYRFCDMPLFTVATDSCTYFFLSFFCSASFYIHNCYMYVVVYIIYDTCSIVFFSLTTMASVSAAAYANYEYFINGKSSCSFFILCTSLLLIRSKYRQINSGC